MISSPPNILCRSSKRIKGFPHNSMCSFTYFCLLIVVWSTYTYFVVWWSFFISNYQDTLWYLGTFFSILKLHYAYSFTISLTLFFPKTFIFISKILYNNLIDLQIPLFSTLKYQYFPPQILGIAKIFDIFQNLKYFSF